MQNLSKQSQQNHTPVNSDNQKKLILYKKLKSLVQNDHTSKQNKQKENLLKKLPQSFWKFMKQRQINIEEVLVQVPRFIRLKQTKFQENKVSKQMSSNKNQIKKNEQNNQSKQIQNKQDPELNFNLEKDKNQLKLGLKQYQINVEITEDYLIQDLAISKQNIIKINDFCYALSPSCKINHSKLYEQGKLYGMDISSMYAVECLDLKQNNKLLQLCSAPGNKSMYACDLETSIKVVGIQINPSRANVMKNLISKYKLSQKIQVKVQDATKYQPEQLFDRVLVDAQCTHQGSVKHLKKFTKNQQVNETKKQKKNKKMLTKQQQKQFQFNHNPYTSVYDKKNEWSAQDFQKRFLDPVKLSNLYDLQYNLIKNGFKCLKQEGIMVYSTCSIDKRQNQDIVSKLLQEYKEQAVLMDAQQSLKECPLIFKKGILKQTVYFTPNLSMCGGMFISKIKKVKIRKA